MNVRHIVTTLLLAAGTVACNQQADQAPAAVEEADMNEPASGMGGSMATIESIELAPGLTARILKAGAGQTATAGDSVEVHYTGWLYEPEAADHRGAKFDSSVDRGQRFQFPLGAGRVIKGWDQGVAGMQIGELRELTIAPEMGYGDRGAGNVIPPGATLVFEVELFGLESPSDTPSQ